MLSRVTSIFTGSPSLSDKLKENPKLLAVVRDWENNHSDTMFLDGPGFFPAPGTAPGGPNIGKPVFQYKKEPFTDRSQGGLKVGESENCVCFIPGGFRGAPTLNTMNPYREDIGKDSTLQSLVHVLTIPKTKRIYNAATLNHTHQELLAEMKSLGESCVRKLLQEDSSSPGSLQWVLDQDDTIEVDGVGQFNTKLVATDMLNGRDPRESPVDISNATISNTFHVYPAASVGWLHLHTFVDELMTTAYKTMEDKAQANGYRKNTPYDEVFKWMCTV